MSMQNTPKYSQQQIHNGHKVDEPKSLTNKHSMVHLHSGILLSREKE